MSKCKNLTTVLHRKTEPFLSIVEKFLSAIIILFSKGTICIEKLKTE
jgi:hypothetical protein